MRTRQPVLLSPCTTKEPSTNSSSRPARHNPFRNPAFLPAYRRLAGFAAILPALLFLLLLPVSASEPATSPTASATPACVILVDGTAITFPVAPLIQSGRTLVPFRAIAESLGIAVNWVQETQTVHAVGYGKVVDLKTGSRTASVDGKAVPLDIAPFITSQHAVIPLRFFGEAFGCKVNWDGPNRTVRVVSPLKAMEITAWYAMDNNWTSLFGAAYPDTATGGTDALGRVVFGWYEMKEDGSLSTTGTKGWKKPSGWESALAGAQNAGLKVDLCAYMSDGSGELTRLMQNPSAWQTAAASLVQEAASFDGVHLDLEGLGMTDTGDQLIAVRQQFTGFAGVVSAALHASGKTLTLTLHPTNSAYKGYDLAALAPLADRIHLMAYDYGQKPEPSSLVQQAITQALAVVPKEKLVLGISLASETPDSLLSKLAMAKRSNLAGVSLWRLGLMQEADWSSLRSSVKPIR